MIDSSQLCKFVVQGMQNKKGQSIAVIDLRKMHNSIADFFVICSATSNTQVESIGDSVQETVKKNTTDRPWHEEGRSNREWILIDYVDVVAHVFLEDKRLRFRLEELWGDATITHIKETAKQEQ